VNIGGNKVKYLLLAAVIILAVFLIYGLHYRDYSKCNGCASQLYPYPIHGDEWTHLAQGMYYMEKEGIYAKNPYIALSSNDSYRSLRHDDLELGFHLFIAQFFKLTGLDPVLNQQFLPAIFIVISILSIFLFVYLVTKNFYIGVIAGLFFLSIKGNVNIYHIGFFVPIIVSTFLIFLFFYTYLREDLRNLSIVFFIMSLTFYPLATVFITSVLVIYLLYNKKLKRTHIYYGAALFVLMVLLTGFTRLKDFLIFKQGWTLGQEIEYSLLQIYGWIGILFAIIGIYFLFKKQYNRILLMTLVFPLCAIMSYPIFKATLLLPYQRSLFFMMLAMVPLSAIGAYHSLELIFIKIKNHIVSISIISILVLILLTGAFYNYYYIADSKLSPAHIISDSDYEALSWIKSNLGVNNRIMMAGVPALGVYPISYNKLYAVPESSLRAGNISRVMLFFSSDCEVKYDLLNKLLNNIIYSKNPLDCDFLNLVYSKNNIYVYVVK